MRVKEEISKAFHSHAATYESLATVQREIGLRTMERLQYLKKSPERILDLGCGTGVFSQALVKAFPKAQVIGLDIAQGMLIQAKSKQGFRSKWSLVAGDMQNMPFAGGTFDLVFANQVVHWGASFETLFRELNRVMQVNACLMFTTLGPDTFKEITKAWSGVNSHAHVNTFLDMHDIGDALLAERFVDPVMDREELAMHYTTLPQLLAALKGQGVKNIHDHRAKGLTGKTAWRQFSDNYAQQVTPEGKYPLSYEVLYGHAWKGMQGKTAQGVETVIPISLLQGLTKTDLG